MAQLLPYLLPFFSTLQAVGPFRLLLMALFQPRSGCYARGAGEAIFFEIPKGFR